MQQFLELPILGSSFDGHNFTIARRFGYVRKDGTELWVPEGALTDGASIPQMFWNILPPFGLYWPAVVLHDYLYRLAMQYDRAFCDATALEAMETLGVGVVTRLTIYDGIRLGGAWAFDDDRHMKIKAEQVVHAEKLRAMFNASTLKSPGTVN